MAVEIKFCGLTRPEDAQIAASLGASYVGVIFAGGPRALTPERASQVLADVPSSVKRVGVFAGQSMAEVRRVVEIAKLDIAQIHADVTSARVGRLKRELEMPVWLVIRVSEALPDSVAALIDVSDGLLLDAFVPGALGGTGVSFAWTSIARELQAVRRDKPIILAGGLRPENVSEAIATLSPDVVDVSSGVESSPGIKDHERMRAFRDAVTHASISA